MQARVCATPPCGEVRASAATSCYEGGVTSSALSSSVAAKLRDAAGGSVVVLTGAGVSAESGIPTFRGAQGYWVAGGRNYQPMELATRQAFLRRPPLVWSWYLHRRGVCLAASPGAAHMALVDLEQAFETNLTLVTQNVDGLHRRAGSSPSRTYAIHGDIDRMRCLAECSTDVWEVPAELPVPFERGRELAEAELAHLRCPRCGGLARPHVLWFDECYDEPRFRFESALAAVAAADLLLVVGTSGATNLPTQMVDLALRQGAAVVVLNLDPSPFTRRADASPAGAVQLGEARALVPAAVDVLVSARASSGG